MVKFSLIVISVLAYWATLPTSTVVANVRDAVSINTARIFYYKDETSKPKKWRLINAKNIPDEIDDNKYTVLYIHDHEESQESESVRVTHAAYHVRNEFNVLVLDWEQLAGASAFEAGKNTVRLAPFLAQALIDMFDTKKITVDKFSIVGHGMGAHIGGHAAKIVRDKTDNVYRIRRVTGLDPTLYPFYPAIYRSISKEDASFVDIIHTDAWGVGTPVSTGSADFWPNEGRGAQPGCKQQNWGEKDGDSCSHRRAWRYWAESVSYGVEGSKNHFHCKKCSSWYRFVFDACYDNAAQNHMGLGANKNMKGDFYLQTNSRSQYSRDTSGVIYDKNYWLSLDVINKT